MDARLTRIALALFVVLGFTGARYTTPNFIVDAPTAEFAKQVGDLAEHYRDEIALEWLGKTLPKWSKPCPIKIQVGQMGAGGATSFQFGPGQDGETHVFGWRMTIQGTPERILDSVLPHEISHTIFACHFRRPLPRWADEGAATLVEHESEQRRQVLLLNQILKNGRRIPLRQLLPMKEYPQDSQNVMTLYAQGYSLADFLVQAGGKQRYLQFLEDAHRHGWNRALQSHYGLESADALEERWDGWVMAGSPRLNVPEGQQLAGASGEKADPQLVVRSQTPDDPAEAQPSVLPNGMPRRAGGRSQAPVGQQAGTAVPRNRGDSATTSPRNQGPRPNAPATAASGHSPASPGGGRERALNEGWVPVPEDRRPRPLPLSNRQEFSATSPSAAGAE